jgi:predicted DNA-binding protein (UPF0251 family)
MSRPKIERKILHCALPDLFNPKGCCACGKIILDRDEIEAIKLIDCEGNDQETAAGRMQISRTTLQRIYKSARKKIACALIEGKKLIFEKGGD